MTHSLLKDLVAISPLDGAGILHVGDRAVCDVIYHVIVSQDVFSVGNDIVEGLIDVQGYLRRVDRRVDDFFEFVGKDDVSIDLQRDNLWWNCIITNHSGDAVSRQGALHRREPT